MSSLKNWTVSFTETFPDFPQRTHRLDELGYPSDKATRTVAVLGFGRRKQVFVTSGSGAETEGSPQNFDPQYPPNGRYFSLASFPVDPASFKVFRGLNGTYELPKAEYLLDATNGYVVLSNPVRRGETIITDSISFSDVNHPRFFLAEQAAALYAIYGQPGGTNTISSGVELAIANGAKQLVVVQGDHSGKDPYWFQAYAALSTLDAYFVVPMHGSYYRNIVAAGLSSTQQSSDVAHRRERILLVGEVQRENIDDPNYFDRSVVTDFNNEERMLLLVGDEITTVIQGESQIAEGGYLAAACAGLWSSYEYVPEPLTRKSLARLSQNWKNPDRYTQKQIDQFAKEGMTLILPKNGISIVYQGAMTLTDSNPVDAEPSIWRIRDYVALSIREVLQNRFAGQVILKDTPKEVEKVTILALQGLVSQKIITKFAEVRVYVDPLEPRQMDIGFSVAPVFPLNGVSVAIRVLSSL